MTKFCGELCWPTRTGDWLVCLFYWFGNPGLLEGQCIQKSFTIAEISGIKLAIICSVLDHLVLTSIHTCSTKMFPGGDWNSFQEIEMLQSDGSMSKYFRQKPCMSNDLLSKHHKIHCCIISKNFFLKTSMLFRVNK